MIYDLHPERGGLCAKITHTPFSFLNEHSSPLFVWKIARRSLNSIFMIHSSIFINKGKVCNQGNINFFYKKERAVCVI